MFSTFNAYGSASKDYGSGSKPVWLGDVKPHAVGGVLVSGARIAGALYAAGTPVYLNAGTITPFIAWEVVSIATVDTNDNIVIKPCMLGDVTVLPTTSDFIQKVGSTFAATGKAAAVASVTALTGSDAGKYQVTVLHSATIDSVSAGDFITLSSAVAAGSSKSLKVQPNGYLYNDIFLGDLSSPVATGAVVDFHGEGILIDFTPAAGIAAQMKTAVPHVIQVAFPNDAFVTIS